MYNLEKTYPSLYSEITALPLSSEIFPFEDYLIVKTNEKPDYLFGNYIFSFNPIKDKMIDDLLDIWKQHFSDDQKFSLIFEVFGDNSQIDSYLNDNDNFEVNKSVILKFDQFKNPESRINYVIKKIKNETEWKQATDLMIAELAENKEAENFINWRMREYYKLINNNQADWWAVWNDNELIACAGVVFKNNIFSFQDVLTKTTFRNKGICKNFCFQLLNNYLNTNKNIEFYVISEEYSFAHKAYRSIGFKEIGFQYQLSYL